MAFILGMLLQPEISLRAFDMLLAASRVAASFADETFQYATSSALDIFQYYPFVQLALGWLRCFVLFAIAAPAIILDNPLTSVLVHGLYTVLRFGSWQPSTFLLVGVLLPVEHAFVGNSDGSTCSATLPYFLGALIVLTSYLLRQQDELLGPKKFVPSAPSWTKSMAGCWEKAPSSWTKSR